MKNKLKWFHIIVDCHSTETFSVQARSEAHALKQYEAGNTTLRGDEVESRDVLEVEERGDVQ